MSTLLLQFTYDGRECAAEYEISGNLARLIAAIAGHPGAVKVIRANVTFFHKGIDDGANCERVKGEAADRSELARDFFCLELPLE